MKSTEIKQPMKNNETLQLSHAKEGKETTAPDLHVEVHALKCQVKKHLFSYISQPFWEWA